MKFLTLLRQASGRTFFLALIISALSGAFSTYVISLVHTFINEGIGQDPYYVWKFIGSTFLFGVTGVYSSYLISILTQAMIFKLRTDLTAKVLQTSFQKSERNLEKILPVLTADINYVSASMNRLPPVTTGLATAIGCIIYLFFLSWKLTIGSFILFSLVFLINYFSLPFLKKYSEQARNVWDKIHKNFEGIVYGMKELKLNKEHRDIYISKKIEPNCHEEKRHRVKEEVLYAASARIAEVVLLLGIGIFIGFIGDFSWVDRDMFAAYLLVLVFTVAPISTVTGFLKHLKRTQVSLEKIHDLGINLEKEPEFNTTLLNTSNWDKSSEPIFSFNQVGFSYDTSTDEDKFSIGPINLEVNAGEIVYIIGGNGTGKTTLIKLLTGLYEPSSGQLLYKGINIEKKDLDNYRMHFAGVFTDYYLFDDLLHVDEDKVKGEATDLLKQLEIDHKVKIKDQTISTTKLSYGQRKRLAMMISILEDKDIYIFDEWAANQDPYFKEIFYAKLLPMLKQRGKTIVAISHDEKYFKNADKVVKMAEGQLTEVNFN